MMVIKRSIICLPAIDWQYLFHRPQQLMIRLAGRGHQVHVRNPGQVPGSAPEQVFENIWVYRDFDKLSPEVASKAIYFIYYPAYAGWIDPSPDQFIVYDCIDDDPVFAGHEELMLAKADLVLCVSRELMRKFEGKHSRLLLLSNGVDLEHYGSSNEICPEEMQKLQLNGKVILGFTGAFYRGWVDIDLLYWIAFKRPNWQIVIIGESYGWDFTGAPSNLIYLGSRPYQQLPAYVRAFDVGLIPFIDNQISRGADPVKLYEYLAAGVPVVSADLPFANGLNPPLMYTYSNREECLNAITHALNDNQRYQDSGKAIRLKFATLHTWDHQVKSLVRVLSEHTWLEKE